MPIKYKEDLTGKTFGKWTVLSKDISKNNHWICQCSCENKIVKSINVSHLMRRKTLSCGCERSKQMSQQMKKYNTYNLTGEYGIGYTSKGEEFYFDLEDYDLIKNYCWHYATRKYVTSRTKDQKMIKMHQLITGYKNPDHINRKPWDNRKCNLRPATQSKNIANGNKRKNNKTGVIGVCWAKNRNKYMARIEKDYNEVYLGYFVNLEEAIIARLKAEKEYFGEFAPQRHLFEQYGI